MVENLCNQFRMIPDPFAMLMLQSVIMWAAGEISFMPAGIQSQAGLLSYQG